MKTRVKKIEKVRLIYYGIDKEYIANTNIIEIADKLNETIEAVNTLSQKEGK